MNLGKIQRDLLITSNIMNFDDASLLKMYAYDEKKCEDFLQKLSDMVILGYNYIMLLFQSYDKLLSFTDSCLEKYPENEKIRVTSQYLKKVIEIEQKRDKSLSDYADQAISLFETSIGAFKLPNITSLSQIIFIMLKSSFDIEKALKDDSSLSDFCEFYEKSKDREYVDPERNYVDSMLNLLKASNSKFKLCFDTNFLVTANYLILGYHPGTKVDDEFINLVKEVISISLNTSIKNDIPGFDENLYKKVAKVTLKNIDKYEKNKKQKQEKTLRKQ